HCVTAATRGRCVVQHLFCDELARRSDRGPDIGDRPGDLVLGADDRHGIRLARAVRASRDGEHGDPAADQPRLHTRYEPRLYPGIAGGYAPSSSHGTALSGWRAQIVDRIKLSGRDALGSLSFGRLLGLE